MENKNQIENQSEPENSGIGEKTALVAILGRPSAGKSTFINTACQEPVSIVSPIPQTTRNAIRGIVNTSLGQLVFVDTPGYHDSEKKLNLRLKSVTEETLEGSDCILYVIDTTREPGEEEKMNATLASKYVEHLVELWLCHKQSAVPAVLRLLKFYHLFYHCRQKLFFQ